jgi:hypothetical protein
VADLHLKCSLASLYERRKPRSGVQMTDPSPDDNSENKKIQLETAKIELELKKRELTDKSSRWREISRNPSVVVELAAVLGSGISGLITAGFQAHRREQNFKNNSIPSS